MGSVRQPRGRLPRRVYWIRRSVVLGVALLLVFGIGKLLGGTGEDPAASDLEASTTSGQQQEAPEPSVTVAPVAPSTTPQGKGQNKAPLLPPNGVCADDEVSVLPSVPRAWGAQPILIRLGLTGLQPACTFKVSPESLVLKITSGDDRIWSSQDCPHAIKTADVVVRSGVPTYVNVLWSGRRSDETCSRNTEWANKGFYHAFAAALGSTPTDVQFQITRAPTAVVTKTAKPKPSATATPGSKTSTNPKPKSSPSPTVSGKESKCGGDNSASSC
jgi:hypothetical protein